LDAVVVVGNVTPMAVYVPFQVIVCADPLSRIRKINLLPSRGVPVGALIVKLTA
jgi:hypothetical protein